MCVCVCVAYIYLHCKLLPVSRVHVHEFFQARWRSCRQRRILSCEPSPAPLQTFSIYTMKSFLPPRLKIRSSASLYALYPETTGRTSLYANRLTLTGRFLRGHFPSVSADSSRKRASDYVMNTSSLSVAFLSFCSTVINKNNYSQVPHTFTYALPSMNSVAQAQSTGRDSIFFDQVIYHAQHRNTGLDG